MSLPSLNLWVDGIPQPKGSVSGFVRTRKDGSPYGTVVHSSKSKAWEAVIRTALVDTKVPVEVQVKPLEISLDFFLPKPRSVKRRFHTTTPDIDKLERAVLDGLKSVIGDDSHVVRLKASKWYAEETPGVRIQVWVINEYETPTSSTFTNHCER